MNGIKWFSGQRVLEDHMVFEQSGRISSENSRMTDLWSNGTIKGLYSNLNVSIDGITSTLLNVGQGIGYANGNRIAITSDSIYDGTKPSTTTGGVSTPQSTGNRAIGLADYTPGTFNYIWAEYLETIDPNTVTINPADGTAHYIDASDGYQIVVTTTNPPNNPVGITNGLFLGRVTANGTGVAITGLTDLGSRLYMQLYAIDAITSSSIADNSISTSKIQNSAITNAKISTNAISTSIIMDYAISTNKVQDSSITPAKISAGIIAFNQLMTESFSGNLSLPAGTLYAFLSVSGFFGGGLGTSGTAVDGSISGTLDITGIGTFVVNTSKVRMVVPCPTPDMEISTRRGMKKAGALKTGDELLSVDEKGKLVNRKVTAVRREITEFAVEVVTNYDTCKVSWSHMFMHEIGKFTPAIYLRKGDTILTVRNNKIVKAKVTALNFIPKMTEVVAITVDDTHVYVVQNMISHNVPGFSAANYQTSTIGTATVSTAGSYATTYTVSASGSSGSNSGTGNALVVVIK
jgi:hypothetical protein